MKRDARQATALGGRVSWFSAAALAVVISLTDMHAAQADNDETAPSDPITVSAEDEFDPTDPTNVVASASVSFEHVEFENSLGHAQTWAAEAWIPLAPKDLLTVEVRLVDPELNRSSSNTVYSGDLLYSGLGESSEGDAKAGFGDIRMRYFHLFGVENAGPLRAWAPSLDVSFPAGDPDKATGGDYWIVSPNAVLAFDLTENFSAYTFLRYVMGFPTRDLPEIHAANIEAPLTLAFSETTFLTVTPNFFHDFGKEDTTFLTGKLGLTQMFSESLGITAEGTVPVAGDNGTDFATKVSLFFFF